MGLPLIVAGAVKLAGGTAGRLLAKNKLKSLARKATSKADFRKLANAGLKK